MSFYSHKQHSRRGRARSEVWEFRLVFAAIYLVMLVSAVFARLNIAHLGENNAKGSIFQEARARTDRVVPFVFMG